MKVVPLLPGYAALSILASDSDADMHGKGSFGKKFLLPFCLVLHNRDETEHIPALLLPRAMPRVLRDCLRPDIKNHQRDVPHKAAPCWKAEMPVKTATCLVAMWHN